MIKLRELDLCVLATNLIFLLMGATYSIFYNLSTMALTYAEFVDPQAQSGIFVFILFGQMCYTISVWLVAMVDIFYILRQVQMWNAKRNEGWL